MGQQGRLMEWNDERGFGFITPLDGGPRVFVHVSQFPRDKRRPAALDLLTYSLDTDDRGRLRASGVRFLTPTRARHTEPAQSSWGAAVTVAASFLVAVTLLTVAGAVPRVVPGAYWLLSVLLFSVYGFDKSAAQDGGWRTSESTLHLLSLAGGWPGALVAQRIFRHKTTKQPFQSIFWGTVAGNCVLLSVFVLAQAASPA